MQRFLECDHNVRFYVSATFGCRSASAEPAECGTTASAAKKRFEEIAEPSSAELELNSAAAVAAPLMKSAAGLLALPLRRRLKTAAADSNPRRADRISSAFQDRSEPRTLR